MSGPASLEFATLTYPEADPSFASKRIVVSAAQVCVSMSTISTLAGRLTQTFFAENIFNIEKPRDSEELFKFMK
jgi:hypothetical protein